MTDTPSQKWKDFASKAGKWTFAAAKEATERGIEAAKAADKMVREEVQRQKDIFEARREAEKREEERQIAEQQEIAKKQAFDAAEQLKRRRIEAAAREPFVREWFANKMNNVQWETGEVYYGKSTDQSRPPKTTYSCYMGAIKLARSLSSMTSGEAEILTYLDLLLNYELIDQASFNTIKTSIIYNEGRCEKRIENYVMSGQFAQANGIKSQADAIHMQMGKWGCASPQGGIALFLSRFSAIDRDFPHFPIVVEIKSRLMGGSNWLRDNDIPNENFSFQDKPGALLIGETISEQRLYYVGEGSLVSIAPPGSGKTQCNVFPNLLAYEGPAIVLDVKGECFEKTGAWRARNVGPIYRFSPLEVETSAKYNPLAAIENNPETLWEDAKLLAELLIVPEDKNDPSWENRARDVIAGIIAWLVRHKPEADRKMGQIIDVISKIGWDDFLEDARNTFEIPPLSRQGNSLAVMPEKQLEGVLDAARRHLAVWEGSRVEKVTSESSWNADVLRDGSNSTIYICIPPNQIETYAPLLRVVFAQHLRVLMHELPSRGRTPILFMLDELPRLGPMKPVEEALEVGRQYGIKLWMFAQSLGQFERSYQNAEGMLGSCAVRIYMNPSSHDGTAKRISEELGFADSLLDGSRHPVVEPSALTGPEFKDWQIVFARDSRPNKVRKLFAYAKEPFKSRMASAPR